MPNARQVTVRQHPWIVLAGALGLGLLGGACEMVRPSGAYDGGPLPSQNDDDETFDVQHDEFDPAAEGFDIFDTPPGSAGDPPLGSDGEVIGPSPEGGPAAPDPLEMHAGDYYFKTVTKSLSDGGSTLGTVTATSTAYGQMRVLFSNGQLISEEKLCFVQTEQSSSEGAKLQVSLPDSTVQEFRPVLRTFEVNGSSWSTVGFARRRQGWRESDPDVMPMSKSDPDLDDPDFNGKGGYATTVSGTASLAGVISASRTCEYEVVGYADTRFYEGTFASDGVSFAGARVDLDSSGVYALSAALRGGTGSCSPSDLNDAGKTTVTEDTIALVRVDELANHRQCADKSAYSSRL